MLLLARASVLVEENLGGAHFSPNRDTFETNNNGVSAR